MMKLAFPQRMANGFGWFSIIRLGLVQAALGAIVVLTTSTLNRVMVVELALAAVVPGALVGLHYAVQITRPLWGDRSDKGGSRSLFILGGMALLALAGTGAAASTLLIESNMALGLAAAALAYLMIGVGIGACGTSLLALLASHTPDARRPAAATIVWIMMIAGIVVTAATTGSLLDPYSHQRLIWITACTGAIALFVSVVALTGLERKGPVEKPNQPHEIDAAARPFSERLRETLADPDARLFTIFVFVSMLAYSTQDLILEPFGGLLFGMTPGETTKLSGMQHGGVLLGMIVVGLAGSLAATRKGNVLRMFTIVGCIGSALALALLALASSSPEGWPLQANVFALGLFNGLFTVAAIGTMMALAAEGRGRAEGIRMGVWGAAQAIAFGLGGFLGTVAVDLTRWATGSVPSSFATVFAGEALLFLASALIALRIVHQPRTATPGVAELRPAE